VAPQRPPPRPNATNAGKVQGGEKRPFGHVLGMGLSRKRDQREVSSSKEKFPNLTKLDSPSAGGQPPFRPRPLPIGPVPVSGARGLRYTPVWPGRRARSFALIPVVALDPQPLHLMLLDGQLETLPQGRRSSPVACWRSSSPLRFQEASPRP